MARTKLEINKDDFQKVVTDLENAQTFTNPSHLWKAVEASDWAKNLKPRPLTAAVAYVRAKELGIVVKTAPGKRGNPGGPVGGGAPRVRVPRAKKMQAFSKTFAKMRKSTPARFLPLVDKAEKGSMKACIKLKCLECSAWQSSEVRLCVIDHCPLFPIRPFQGKGDLEVMDLVTEKVDKEKKAEVEETKEFLRKEDEVQALRDKAAEKQKEYFGD